MKHIYLLSLIFSCIFFINHSHAEPKSTLIGDAIDTKTNSLVYQERHSFEYVDGNKVMRSEFIDPQGKLIAKRTVKFQDDYVKAYSLEQAQLEYRESVIRNVNGIELMGKNGDKTKSEQLIINNEVIIDAGFSNYIVRNWDDLNKGETKRFNYASIGQMGAVKLQVKKVDLRRTSAFDNGVKEDVVMFKMTVANPFLRLLIKPIEVGYYQDSKQFAYYQGISNIKDRQGKRYTSIRIQFPNSAAHTITPDHTVNSQSTNKLATNTF